MSSQLEIDKAALKWLKRLEFEPGKLIAYEELETRLQLLASLEGKGETFVNQIFDILEDSSHIRRYFKIEGP